MHTYRYMAEYLNKNFHQGKRVRTESACRRREGHVVWGKPWGRCSNACMSESPTNNVNREGGTKRANGDSLHAEVMPRQQH